MTVRKYIGDGILVDIADNGSIVIWDDNGPEKVNQVVLEPEVFTRLVEYASRHTDEVLVPHTDV